MIRAIVIPALAAGMTLSPVAHAQAPGGQPVPSVGVQPFGTDPNDPNGGQWFVASLAPGQSGKLQAKISNPASVAQTIRIGFADLKFLPDGTPEVVEPAQDVGTWATIGSRDVMIPASGNVIVPFSVTVPQGAEPGDHVGVFVVDTLSGETVGNQQIGVVRRIATRLYVTVPGDARREFSIEGVRLTKDSTLFPTEMTIEVLLRNNGRIRLRPVVRVGGRFIEPVTANGSSLLLTSSVEKYIATVPIPLWGGPLQYRVDATTDQGTSRQARASAFVIPWWLLIILIAVAFVVWMLRTWLHKRKSRYNTLQSDLRRIEQLLHAQATGSPVSDVAQDPDVAINAAMKQARRSGDTETEERLKEKLKELRDSRGSAGASVPPKLTTPPVARRVTHDKLPDDLSALLAEIGDATGPRLNALVRAARQYGRDELARHLDVIEQLPRHARAALFHDD